jgi:DnaJ family protein C protein 13
VGIQAAYERLQAGAAGGQGPQPWRLLLLLRAQCVLFRRAPDVLQPFKYAGYPLLLQAIALPEDGGQGPAGQHFLSAEAAPQLQAATELCWLTCACSRLNGDELARAGGLRLLARLLMRCIAVMPRDVHAVDPAAVIATHALRALAVMAAFESTRGELAHSSQLVSDIGKRWLNWLRGTSSFRM